MINGIKNYNRGTKIKCILLILTLCIPGISYAQNKFTFDQPVLRGTGCPRGTTSVIMSPDNQEITLLFDRFSAEVPQVDGDNDNDLVTSENPGRGNRRNKNRSHKVCNMIVSASLPEMRRIVGLGISIDFRGSTIIENNARAVFRAVLLKWKGPRGKRGKRHEVHRRAWRGQFVNDNWFINLHKLTKLRSGCSKKRERKVVFKLRNIIMASIPKRVDATNASALITLDSQDISGKMKFRVRTAPCRNL
ncbi:MAG: DUF4360 domain-containing protein [Bacteriovoracaceae bacterium]|jgi:hypothetical protein|nr:DUF4360 domain-containing protein [Bacteriovoracaceae bacterium]